MTDKRTLSLHLAVTWLILTASIWLSSGTMAPYAATLDAPVTVGACGYIYNIDHDQFRGAFWMLEGEPRVLWERSVVLRRILFPAVAYPLMKALGFELGGVVASVALHWTAFFLFLAFVRKTVGHRGAIVAAWLLASYPGVAYWAGLPYVYVTIVPFSLLAFIALWALQRFKDVRVAASATFVVGFLALAYDFLPIFGGATLLILIMDRRLMQLPLAAFCLVVPSAGWAIVLRDQFQIPLLNSNSSVYGDVIGAWLHRPSFAQWGHLLLDLPRVTALTYLGSNFVVLPGLFLVLWVFSRSGPRVAFERCEVAVILSTTLLFAVINAAPYYPNAVIRGPNLARMYQSLFVVFIYFAARVAEAATLRRRLLNRIFAAAVIANASIAFGTALHTPWTNDVYLSFYRHAQRGMLDRNLARYGRRPLGFCKRDL